MKTCLTYPLLARPLPPHRPLNENLSYLLFTYPPPPQVFMEPVISKCGHTFCMTCVLTLPSTSGCPVHKTPLGKTPIIPNITVAEQVCVSFLLVTS